MPTPWIRYLQPANASAAFSECHQRCRSSFDEQRRNITRVFEATHPSAVACLGAGTLNDIPYDIMIRSGVHLHLVDWMEASVDTGIDLSIIQTNKDGDPVCVYCQPSPNCPEKYCHNYVRPQKASAGVCGNFRPSTGCPIRCEAFERGDRPFVHYEDVTGGFASEFGREILAELQGVRSWKQAFARASALTDRIGRRQHAHLSIADSSVELVTSSMVLSQFEHEPYKYFARQVADILGVPTAKEEHQLRSTMESLRSALMANQIQRHCQEVSRILTPGGHCYMSFELFHPVPNEKHCFLVKGVTKALELIAELFHFDFDIIPEDMALSRIQTSDTPSLSCSFVLVTKKPGSSDG